MSEARTLPSFAKYSVVIEPSGAAREIFQIPNPKWDKKDFLATPKDITRCFDRFQADLSADRKPEAKGLTKLVPGDMNNGIAVFFDPADLKSLIIVAEGKSFANLYAQRLGLKKPFPGEDSRYSGPHSVVIDYGFRLSD
jgi:hypothetical protein